MSRLLDAWRGETKRRRTERRRFTDTEFLAAALEVTETPPSPTGRAILWTIIAAAGFALIWAFASSLDVVAVAEGRVVPRGRLQTVDAAETGVIRAIHVREGQHVEAGQLLVELDPTFADADAGTARSELSTAALTRARSAALMAYAAGRAPVFQVEGDVDPAAAAAERQVVDARIREYEAKRASLLQRRAGAEASVAMAEQEVLKLSEVLPLSEQQLSARKVLESKGLAPRLRVLEAEERVVGQRRDLEVQRARLNEAQSQVGMLDRELAQAVEEFRGAAAREKAEAESVVATRTEGVRKADQRMGMQRLVAPVSGIVNEVSVTTLGEVAEAGQALVTVVPDTGPGRDELIVEALVLNRDAGFVKPGDPVVVKVEAYPFTRYGTLNGRLEHVSADAVVDEARGLVFPARVRLGEHALMVDGRRATLTPGMSTVTEIVTGRRRVIDYLWSPVARATSEAGRER